MKHIRGVFVNKLCQYFFVFYNTNSFYGPNWRVNIKGLPDASFIIKSYGGKTPIINNFLEAFESQPETPKVIKYRAQVF